MRADFRTWLKKQGYTEKSCGSRASGAQRIEQYYGSLDRILSEGRFGQLIDELTYSAEDERRNRPNPSRIKFNGNNRNNLASYKSAAQLYAQFWTEMNRDGGVADAGSTNEQPDIVEPFDPLETDTSEKQRLALERDMQGALRRDITALRPDLSIIDGGAEHRVASGNIDILCENGSGALVVVELKAGVTDARVIAQILGYMGDLIDENPGRDVLGIVVAHDFDKRTRAASRAIPNVQLMSYEVSFSFNLIE